MTVLPTLEIISGSIGCPDCDCTFDAGCRGCDWSGWPFGMSLIYVPPIDPPAAQEWLTIGGHTIASGIQSGLGGEEPCGYWWEAELPSPYPPDPCDLPAAFAAAGLRNLGTYLDPPHILYTVWLQQVRIRVARINEYPGVEIDWACRGTTLNQETGGCSFSGALSFGPSAIPHPEGTPFASYCALADAGPDVIRGTYPITTSPADGGQFIVA